MVYETAEQLLKHAGLIGCRQVSVCHKNQALHLTGMLLSSASCSSPEGAQLTLSLPRRAAKPGSKSGKNYFYVVSLSAGFHFHLQGLLEVQQAGTFSPVVGFRHLLKMTDEIFHISGPRVLGLFEIITWCLCLEYQHHYLQYLGKLIHATFRVSGTSGIHSAFKNAC